MKNVKEVRKSILLTGEFKGRLQFRKALEELLEVRELTVYDMVYSLNGGKYSERLRRRIHNVMINNDQFVCVSIASGSGKRRTYSLASKTEVAIDVNKHKNLRNPVVGLEELLTQVLNDGLGESVRRGGVGMIDFFKKLPVKQQTAHIMSLANKSKQREIAMLFIKSGNHDMSDREYERVLRRNAQHVVYSVNKEHEFFRKIVKIYG